LLLFIVSTGILPTPKPHNVTLSYTVTSDKGIHSSEVFFLYLIC